MDIEQGFWVCFIWKWFKNELKEREFGIELIATAPSVIYQVNLTNHTTIEIDNPSKLPSPQEIESIMEPYVKATIMCPSEYIGSVMDLSQKKRGIFLNMSYLDPTRAEIKYELPLSEIVFDFFDKLKVPPEDTLLSRL